MIAAKLRFWPHTERVFTPSRKFYKDALRAAVRKVELETKPRWRRILMNTDLTKAIENLLDPIPVGVKPNREPPASEQHAFNTQERQNATVTEMQRRPEPELRQANRRVSSAIDPLQAASQTLTDELVARRDALMTQIENAFKEIDKVNAALTRIQFNKFLPQ